MVFENKKYETMEEIFDLANSLAKEGIKSKCDQFLNAYVTSILDLIPSFAREFAKSNIIASN